MFNPTYPDLHNKVVIITGAAAGIGKATALAFATAGSNLVLADINDGGLQLVLEEIKTVQNDNSSSAIAVRTDVSSSTDVKALIDRAVAAFGRIDIAVNNAGAQPDSAPISELDEEYMQKLVATSFTGVALCLKWELQQMIKQRKKTQVEVHDGSGSSPIFAEYAIINLSSSAVYKAYKMTPIYAAVKHAVVGMTKAAAVEGGEFGIRVNALAPGVTATNLALDSLERLGMPGESYAPQASVFRRFASPEEMAQAVLWLASGQSAYVTGIVLPVDGGLSFM